MTLPESPGWYWWRRGEQLDWEAVRLSRPRARGPLIARRVGTAKTDSARSMAGEWRPAVLPGCELDALLVEDNR